MNNLSLALYLIDVLKNLQSILVTVAVLSTIAAPVCLLLSGLCREEDPDLSSKSYLIFWRMVFVSVLLALPASFIPSQKTMYMILGSESLDRLAQRPEAQEIYEIVKKKLIAP